MLLWLFVIFLILVVYKVVVIPMQYYKKRGVPHRTPLPFVGNFLRVMLRRISFFDVQEEIYNEWKGHRYHGYFQLTSPTLMIRDVELIKQIGVKQFDNFTDHRQIATEADVLFRKNLFSLKGNKWRTMRAFLSPAFTSSKMRGMYGLMDACARRVTTYYVQLNEQSVEVELKDLFTRYANDVIATCAFGLECDSLKDQDNQFFSAGKEATMFTGLRGLKIMLAQFSPEISRFFKLDLFPSHITDFFMNLIKDTIAYRENTTNVRPDVIQLLLDARKGKLKHETRVDASDKGFAVVDESDVGRVDVSSGEEMTDVDIASQCFIFFFAGFDTASTLLSFAVMEMAIHPDIQTKLMDEINAVWERTNGKPGYEDMMTMNYLDMVVSETLRKWPPGPLIDRICTKEFTIDPVTPDEVPVTLQPGDLVAIPILGLHRDPEYFPNPMDFDPERFSEENKQNIKPYTYLPFGVGPRACIGSRFALLESKILLVHLLREFEAKVIAKSCVPIKLTKKNLRIAPDNGFWVGLERRTK